MRLLPKHWFVRFLLCFLIAVIVIIAGATTFILIRPRSALLQLTSKFAPEARFTAEDVHWQGLSRLVIKNAKWGEIFTAPSITVDWNWKDLRKRRLQELRIEKPLINVDLSEVAGLQVGKKPSKDSKKKPFITWYLDKFVVERGGLVMVGLGPTVPPLNLQVEGSWDDLPIGNNLSEADLRKQRTLTLINIHVHSPSDLAVTVLKIEKVTVGLTFAGLTNHELDSLLIERPTIDVDPGLFWFVEELRKARAMVTPTTPTKDWTVHNFQITQGRLDISRFREMSISYPFPFESKRQNLHLRDLSLAESGLELTIPVQDVLWKEIEFIKIHGKIAFHLTESGTKTQMQTGAPKANDLVNTLYVQSIRWKGLEINDGWLALTFDPKAINGNYGGSFAQGYLNGGMAGGWSGKEPWQAWGSAADTDIGVICDAVASERFRMTGRTQLAFGIKGQEQGLTGTLEMKSVSTGTIELKMLDAVLERIQRNNVGMKRELLQIFVGSLKNYPYSGYQLSAKYDKPNATLLFQSQSKLGSRKLDLTWHGDDNPIQHE